MKIYVEKSKLEIREKEKLVSGSVNTYRCQFIFSEDWDGLARTAVFRYNNVPWKVILDESNECAIPWEALINFGRPLLVGVYGTRGGEIVLPTVWASLDTVAEGVSMDGNPAKPPTPGIYEQILQTLGGKADALSYDGETLSLMSGETPLSSVTITGGGGNDGFLTKEEVAQMLDRVFGEK